MSLLLALSGVTYTLSAEAGAFTLTGADAGLYVGRVLAANGGSYVLTGADADLRVIRAYRIDARPGAFFLTGSPVQFLGWLTPALNPETWSPANPTPETWEPEAIVPEDWTPVPVVPEDWT